MFTFCELTCNHDLSVALKHAKDKKSTGEETQRKTSYFLIKMK